jgi:Ni,Fe-hydrogenase III large subunit/Ni,Fe-hydrogenase III component G
VTLKSWWDLATPVSQVPNMRRLSVDAASWARAGEELAAADAQLLALWAAHAVTQDGYLIRAAFVGEGAGLILELPIADRDPPYPGLESFFPAASRMQRATYDLWGLKSTDPDGRPWLRHSRSPEDRFPLRDTTAVAPKTSSSDAYRFVRVDGDGVHEIPVGPVHAGIIEPGHFRFSIVGEKVLRLEERLGYVHKGIERRFTDFPILEGHRLAARVSGDCAVAYAWAYCQALEGMVGMRVPARAEWLRALCLELERIANHLGDLGALGNDAGFAFGLTQFSRLKESLLRMNESAFGQRYVFDTVVPGGVRADLTDSAAQALSAFLSQLAPEVQSLREIYDEHGGVRDRFLDAGRVSPELAARLGLTGFAGRASARVLDVRIDYPCAPYPALAPRRITRTAGDVAARVAVRFDELQESCRLCLQILTSLPSSAYQAECPSPAHGAFGIGFIEGWRGPVFLVLEAGAAGAISRCHPHDPSWQNWPVLEHAIIGNIVPDFPLINKSFNLSYSGHDL